MFDFIGIGSLNLDIIYEVEDLSLLDGFGSELSPGREISCSRETIQELLQLLEGVGRRIAESGGGSAANTIAALAALGWRTGFLGAVGADREGDYVVGSMKFVEMSGVKTSGNTAICLVILGRRERDRALVVSPATGADFSLDQELLALFGRARVVHATSFIQDEGFCLEDRLFSLKRPSQIISLDPGEIYAARSLYQLRSLLLSTDILFITETELEMMTGTKRREGVFHLLDIMCGGRSREVPGVPTSFPLVVVKRGKRGASCYSGGVELSAPALEVEDVVDTTGAGDAFNAGFLHSLMKGWSLERSLKAGHLLASFSIRGYGREWMEIGGWREALEGLGISSQ